MKPIRRRVWAGRVQWASAVILALSPLGCFDNGAKSTPGRVGVTTGTAETGTRDLEQTPTVSIRVSDGRVEINGKSLIFPVEIDTLESAVGKADRKSELKNTIYTWDDQGLLASVKPGAKTVDLITIAYGPESYPFWPRARYSGAIQVDGHKLSAKTVRADLEKAGYVPDPHSPKFWDYKKERKNVAVTLESETYTHIISASIYFPNK